MIPVPTAQVDEATWLADRAGKISASRFHAVLHGSRIARSRYLEELRQASELKHGATPGFEVNGSVSASTQWGHTYEPMARSTVALVLGRQGLTVHHRVGWIPHSLYTEVGCSPDGLVERDGAIVAGLEIKCPYDPGVHALTVVYGWPVDKYEAQVQGSLWVTGLPRWYFASFDPRCAGSLWIHTVEPLAHRHATIERRVLALRENLLQNTEPTDYADEATREILSGSN